MAMLLLLLLLQLQVASLHMTSAANAHAGSPVASKADDLDRRLQPVDIRGPSEFFYMVPLFSREDLQKTEGAGRLDLLMDEEQAQRRANEAELVYI